MYKRCPSDLNILAKSVESCLHHTDLNFKVGPGIQKIVKQELWDSAFPSIKVWWKGWSEASVCLGPWHHSDSAGKWLVHNDINDKMVMRIGQLKAFITYETLGQLKSLSWHIKGHFLLVWPIHSGRMGTFCTPRNQQCCMFTIQFIFPRRGQILAIKEHSSCAERG